MTLSKVGPLFRSLLVAVATACCAVSGSASALSPSGVQTTGTKPSAPQSLTAAPSGSSAIVLSWLPPSSGRPLLNYQIDYLAADGTWRLLATPGANDVTYTDMGLTAGTSRFYQVRARNGYGLGTPAFASATTGTTGAPSAPQNLTATASGSSVIVLSWIAPASGRPIIHYRVEYLAANGTWILLGTPSQTTFRDTGLTAGTVRSYRVSARNASGVGTAASVTGSTSAAGLPGPPRDLTAEAEGASVIVLAWSPPLDPGSSVVTGYRVEVSADGGINWTLLADDHPATDYRHTGLSSGTLRRYRVAAINRLGTGEWSGEASATTSSVPGRPGRLTARARGTSSIELNWSAPSSGASAITGYRIEASPTGTSRWTVLETDADPKTTDYTHTGLDPGTKRYYRVLAINRAGRGDWSNVASATTEIAAPGAPTGLRVTPSGAGGTGQLLLTWTRPTTDGGAEITGYRIEVSSNGISGWTVVVANTHGTGTSFTHSGRAPATTYHYRVSAINRAGRANGQMWPGGRRTRACRQRRGVCARRRTDRGASRLRGRRRRRTTGRGWRATGSVRGGRNRVHGRRSGATRTRR